jgi:hypothetical protein
MASQLAVSAQISLGATPSMRSQLPSPGNYRITKWRNSKEQSEPTIGMLRCLLAKSSVGLKRASVRDAYRSQWRSVSFGTRGRRRSEEKTRQTRQLEMRSERIDRSKLSTRCSDRRYTSLDVNEERGMPCDYLSRRACIISIDPYYPDRTPHRFHVDSPKTWTREMAAQAERAKSIVNARTTRRATSTLIPLILVC